MPGFGLLVPLPSFVMSLIPLILGDAAHIQLLQDPPDPGRADGHIVISQQIHFDLPWTKVIGLPQIEDLSHDFRFRRPRAIVRAF
jgi:hypothetical protein